MPVAAVRD